MTVETFDFMAACELSSAVRHFDRFILTVEMGPWEGAQFPAPAVKSRDFSALLCGTLSTDRHAISFIRIVEKIPSNNRLVLSEVVYYTWTKMEESSFWGS